MSFAKRVERIEVSYGVDLGGLKELFIRWGPRCPHRKGNFEGHALALPGLPMAIYI